MTTKEIRTYDGEIVDHNVRYTLREVCEICGVHAEFVMEMVAHGIVEPHGAAPQRWSFHLHDVQRARRAVRLLHDLELNLPGASLSLDLLDEIDALRARVRRLERELSLLTG